MIPDYQTLMRPVLEASCDGEVSNAEVVSLIANKFGLSEEERNELLPSGRQATFANRVNWAKSYLKQAGLLEYTKRGHFKITAEGEKALKGASRIDNSLLKKYASFRDFQNRSPDHEGSKEAKTTKDENAATPDELIKRAYDEINLSLASDLLDRIRDSSPEFFETLIVDLLVSMGYGGTSDEPGRAIGKSGDGGIDGVVDQDPLGVDQIYIQAKKYKAGNNVGAGEMRDFFGALSLKRATKGIFVTASAFSAAALQTAKDLGSRIVLIDGLQLTKLMIRYNIGCRDIQVLHVKKLDDDYFG